MTDVLVFGAHPDDAEFGMGASLLKLVDNGYDVTVCVLTKGDAGTHGTTDDRVEEMHVAADYGGYDTHLLDYEDCKIIDDFAMRKHLAEIIRFYEPSLLFAPYHTNHGDHHDGKAHPDHCVTGEVVRKAARYAKFEGLDDLDGDAWDADHVVYYMVPSGVEPSFVVDVTPYMDAWHDLISCFSTQLNLKDGKVRAYLERVRENEGWRVGVDYAEVFRTATPVCIDFNDLE